MAMVFRSQGAGQPILVDDLLAKHGTYQVGRWCSAGGPAVPDRCDACDLADIRPAVGYVQARGWRFGFCEQHQAKVERLHKGKGRLLRREVKL